MKMKPETVLECVLLSLLSLTLVASVELPQKPLSLASTVDSLIHDAGAGSKRKLTGKFLHITDMHPDPFYRPDSATDKDNICHRGQGRAGKYGAEVTQCDSPLALLDETFSWIEENLKGKIDFIVWTGDSARHDNDEKFPRSEAQVVRLNQMLVDKFREIFGVDEDEGHYPTGFSVPIVPSIGNNDILPHNIFDRGPNKWTRHFAQIWRPFIPEEQKHGFDRGAWFYVEVIPNRLAVFSLNTMYFFGKNSAVDGCASSTEPGYEHLEWLRIQLQFMRERGVKAILSGHVPPVRNHAKAVWDETCWQKFTLWNKQYRDVIIGALYGHVNIDHFMFHDFDEIDIDVVAGKKKPSLSLARLATAEEDQVSIEAKAPRYLNSFRELWSDLPSMPNESKNGTSQAIIKSGPAGYRQQQKSGTNKSFDAIGGEFAERFALSLVSASVVPNFFPTLRVFEYNITGLEDQTLNQPVPKPPNTWYQHDQVATKSVRKKPKLTIPPGPSDADVPGPAYSLQPLSWLGYKQYFANITEFNRGAGNTTESVPVPRSRGPKKFQYHVEYDTSHQNDSYRMGSGLEVRKWLSLATIIGNYEPQKQKSSLIEVQGFAEDDGYGQDEEDVEDIDVLKKHKHKKGKHHKKHKKPKKPKKPRKKLSRSEKKIAKHAWKTFVVRGTVSTIGKKELKDDYGTPPDDDDNDDNDD